MTRETKGTVIKLVQEDKDLLRGLVQETVQQILETEMTEALGASKGQRSAARRGYRSGYYERSLVTRVGKMELRVPQDREGHFSTELFERYSRVERAFVGALVEMYAEQHEEWQEGSRYLNMLLLVEQKKEQIRTAA